MSRTGKKPIAAVSGVTVSIDGRTVTAKGPKGEQSLTLMDVVNRYDTDPRFALGLSERQKADLVEFLKTR